MPLPKGTTIYVAEKSDRTTSITLSVTMQSQEELCRVIDALVMLRELLPKPPSRADPDLIRKALRELRD